MKKIHISIVLLILFGFNSFAANIIGPWNITQLKRTPAYKEVSNYAVAGMTSILYESIDYLGNKVEVFAYYSAPSGTMPSGGWPAVVYVHGGEGTALPSWVEYWNNRGYACISMDHHGHYPDGSKTPNPGPDKIGTWTYTDQDFDNQWYYHAVAQVIRATSLIGSFSEVNANKIGIMGTSWGGTLTATVMGLDNRLRFAMPVYGGGYLSDSDGIQGAALSDPDVAAYVDANYDGRAYFSNVTIPTLWMNGTNDTNFPMTVTRQSSESVPNAKLCYILRLKHNNVYVQKYEEFAAFANEVIYGSAALPDIEAVTISNGTASVAFTSSVGIASAKMMYSTSGDDVAWIDKEWFSVNATVSGSTISRAIPTGATIVCFTATDSRGYTTSSEYRFTSESTNLALSGTATQSSTNGGDASLAIDGNTDGAFANGSVTQTSGIEDYATWTLQLASEASIDEIVIYNRTNACCKGRLSSFNVFVWDASGTRTARKVISTTPDPSVTIDLGGLSGKTIMIKSNLLNTPLNLAEVEVYRISASNKPSKESKLIADNSFFSISPNPVKDILNIKLETTEAASYQVFDTTGQLLLSGTLNNGAANVDVSHLANGLYLVKVTGDIEVFTGKIVKK